MVPDHVGGTMPPMPLPRRSNFPPPCPAAVEVEHKFPDARLSRYCCLPLPGACQCLGTCNVM